MKLIYISTPYFLDYDINLINVIKETIDVYYVLDIHPISSNATILNINNYKYKTDIYESNIYKELSKFKHLLPLNKTIIINRKNNGLAFDSVKIQIKFNKILKEINPDIIHFNKLASIDYISTLIKYKKKIIQTFHDPIPHSGDNNIKVKVKRLINTAILNNFLLLNINQKNEFIKKYKIDANKHIFISRLGIYEYLSKKYKTNNSNDKSTKYILFFGRISKYKGIEYLLRAFSKIHNENKNITLIIAGMGELYFPTEGLLENVKITNRYLDEKELSQLIIGSEFVVCPYTDATQSGVVMTAYSFNKPVIATDVGGLKEYVTNNTTGIIVRPKDSDAIYSSIKYLLENEEALINYSNNINDLYLKGDYSWNKICNDLVCVYKTISNV